MKDKEFSSAEFITGNQYMDLVNPEFQGQTRPDNKGVYRMYWKVGNKLYYTINQFDT